MAFNTFAPQFFSQTPAPPEMFRWPYLQVGADWTDRVPAGGDRVTYPDYEGTVTTRDYTPHTAIMVGTVDDEQYVLQIDQRKYVAEAVDDVERVQRAPNVIANLMVQGNRQLYKDMHDRARTQFRNSARLNNAITGGAPQAGSPTGLTDNVHTIDLNTTDATGNARAKINSANGREAIIELFDEAYDYGQAHGWIEDGNYAIVDLPTFRLIRQFLRVDKPNLGYGHIVDDVLTKARKYDINGFRILVDQTATRPNLATAASPALRIDFLTPGKSLMYAKQLAEMETYREQSLFNISFKSLWLYGCEQGPARYIFQAQVNLHDS